MWVLLKSGLYRGCSREMYLPLAGRNLEFVTDKGHDRIGKKIECYSKSIVPSWNGGRMPLSANLGFNAAQNF